MDLEASICTGVDAVTGGNPRGCEEVRKNKQENSLVHVKENSRQEYTTNGPDRFIITEEVTGVTEILPPVNFAPAGRRQPSQV